MARRPATRVNLRNGRKLPSVLDGNCEKPTSTGKRKTTFPRFRVSRSGRSGQNRSFARRPARRAPSRGMAPTPGKAQLSDDSVASVANLLTNFAGLVHSRSAGVRFAGAKPCGRHDAKALSARQSAVCPTLPGKWPARSRTQARRAMRFPKTDELSSRSGQRDWFWSQISTRPLTSSTLRKASRPRKP